MLTAKGKTFIKRYLAGQAGNVVGAISVGCGGTAATINDVRLQFEFARIPVAITTYDFTTDSLVFKGSLDETISGKIYEVGLWTSEVNSAAGNQASREVTSFDLANEAWTNETPESTIARIGVDSLKHTPALSTTVTSVLSGLTLDFSGSSSLDTFVVAYNVDNAFCANMKIKFLTDSSNYYTFTITSPSVGYSFASFQKGTATVTGTPDWSNINQVEVDTTATSGGSASVEWDGIRIEDVDTLAPEYGLVARFVPASFVTKTDGLVQDIEYSLAVSL
jgi:hypothetical protein